MRFIYIAFIGCLLAIAGCNNTTDNGGSKGVESKKEPVHSKLSDGGTQALMNVVTSYYGLKNALVATKAARVDSNATALAATTENMQAELQKDSANMVALKPFVDSIISQSKLVNAIKDETCEKQRLVFEIISRNMYALLKAAELKNAHIYHQYCPMAFNDKGAFWLSGESEILNPYFGKKMLECGEVTDSL